MITRSKTNEIREYMATIKETVETGGSLKATKRKLVFARYKMYVYSEMNRVTLRAIWTS